MHFITFNREVKNMTLKKIILKAGATAMALTLSLSVLGTAGVRADEEPPILITPKKVIAAAPVSNYCACYVDSDKTRKKSVTLENQVVLDYDITYPLATIEDEALQKKVRATVYKQAYTNVIKELNKEYSQLAFMYYGRTDAPKFTVSGRSREINQKGNILSIVMNYDIFPSDESQAKSFIKVINVNLTTGKLLKLTDVFKKNAAFKGAISASVKKQMKAQGGTKNGYYAWKNVADIISKNILTNYLYFGDSSLVYFFDDNVLADEGRLGGITFSINYSDLAEYTKDKGNDLMNPTGLYTITLKSNPTTGYSWVYIPANDGMVENVFDKYIPDAVPAGIVGSGGNQVFGFVSTGFMPGKSSLRFIYMRPWEGEENAIDEEIIQIVVTETGFITEVNSEE